MRHLPFFALLKKHVQQAVTECVARRQSSPLFLAILFSVARSNIHFIETGARQHISGFLGAIKRSQSSLSLSLLVFLLCRFFGCSLRCG